MKNLTTATVTENTTVTPQKFYFESNKVSASAVAGHKVELTVCHDDKAAEQFELEHVDTVEEFVAEIVNHFSDEM